MVYASNFRLNCFPVKTGVSDVLSPRAIITGASIDFHNHCQLEFGSYVQTHEDHDNSMASRTVGAIALGPTGNTQGGYYFFSLSTGRVINRNHWTTLPMPNDVISRVHVMARRNPRGLTFADRHRTPYILANDYTDGDDDDSTYNPDEGSDDESEDGDDDGSHNNDNNDDHGYDDLDNDGDVDMVNIPEDDIVPNNEDDVEIMDHIIPDEEANISYVEIDDDEDMIGEDNSVESDEEFDINNEMNAKYGERNSSHNLRKRKERTYGHLHTQYSVNKGLKVFGTSGTEAVLQELVQLHKKEVIEPVHYKDLTQEQRTLILPYLMFLKEKRTGQIKGRGCADGRKQRTVMSKEESSSPTVANESVLLTCTIDAFENRDVATVDIPGAFLHADMDGIVHLRIDGAMADLLISLDPEKYTKYVELRNGKKVIFLLLKKALYGTLKASLLFWQLLSQLLISWGFVINPYDHCVANKMVNSSQFTIVWHVDDLKLSHVDPAEVTKIIELLSKRFGTKESPVTIQRGKVHDYLGMTLDFTKPGVAQITMQPYIENVLKALPDNMSGVSPTPAANHLFDVNPDLPPLNDKDQEFFHHVVAQLLFRCKRGRPNIQTAVAFLCTRVQHPTTEDYNKLTRVIKYLQGTITLPSAFRQIPLPQPTGGLTQHTQYILTSRAILVVFFSGARRYIWNLHLSKKLMPKARLKLNSLALPKYFHNSYGLAISLRLKDFPTWTPLLIRIIRVPFSSATMALPLAANGHAISMFVTFL